MYVCEPYAVWNTLIITLNAWLSRSLTRAQTHAQSRSQSQTQSAITNRILLVARRKRLTTRKCLTVCVYNDHNVLHTQREREKESGRAEE